MPSEHVAGAVLRGLRLPQLSYIGDSLYQLMLQCWQIDLDERPTFGQVLAELENIKSSAEVTLFLLPTKLMFFIFFNCMSLLI